MLGPGTSDHRENNRFEVIDMMTGERMGIQLPEKQIAFLIRDKKLNQLVKQIEVSEFTSISSLVGPAASIISANRYEIDVPSKTRQDVHGKLMQRDFIPETFLEFAAMISSGDITVFTGKIREFSNLVSTGKVGVFEPIQESEYQKQKSFPRRTIHAKIWGERVKICTVDVPREQLDPSIPQDGKDKPIHDVIADEVGDEISIGESGGSAWVERCPQLICDFNPKTGLLRLNKAHEWVKGLFYSEKDAYCKDKLRAIYNHLTAMAKHFWEANSPLVWSDFPPGLFPPNEYEVVKEEVEATNYDLPFNLFAEKRIKNDDFIQSKINDIHKHKSKQ